MDPKGQCAFQVRVETEGEVMQLVAGKSLESLSQHDEHSSGDGRQGKGCHQDSPGKHVAHITLVQRKGLAGNRQPFSFQSPSNTRRPRGARRFSMLRVILATLILATIVIVGNITLAGDEVACQLQAGLATAALKISSGGKTIWEGQVPKGGQTTVRVPRARLTLKRDFSMNT